MELLTARAKAKGKSLFRDNHSTCLIRQATQLPSEAWRCSPRLCVCVYVCTRVRALSCTLSLAHAPCPFMLSWRELEGADVLHINFVISPCLTSTLSLNFLICIMGIKFPISLCHQVPLDKGPGTRLLCSSPTATTLSPTPPQTLSVPSLLPEFPSHPWLSWFS